ncbi:sigma factor-like helix-turn-helix DNA-binding protein [Mammaliicoccus sciuri]|nr:sigma factor-like helix-turn-helix DNA-binding protein [Mammaliicoccus sciuri]
MQQQALEIKKDICIEEMERWHSISYARADLGKKHDFHSRLQQVSRIEEELEELNERIKKLEEQKERVLKLIDRFDGVEHQILKLKYVEGLTHREIADQLGYAEQSIKNIHSRIIKQIDFAFKVNR